MTHFSPLSHLTAGVADSIDGSCGFICACSGPRPGGLNDFCQIVSLSLSERLFYQVRNDGGDDERGRDGRAAVCVRHQSGCAVYVCELSLHGVSTEDSCKKGERVETKDYWTSQHIWN